MPTTHIERRERRRRIASDIRQGLGIEEVCGLYIVSVSLVQVACEENGVTIPRKQRRPAVHKVVFKIISDLLNSDMTQVQIGKRYNVTKQYVQQISKLCEKYNITPPDA